MAVSLQCVCVAAALGARPWETGGINADGNAVHAPPAPSGTAAGEGTKTRKTADFQ